MPVTPLCICNREKREESIPTHQKDASQHFTNIFSQDSLRILFIQAPAFKLNLCVNASGSVEPVNDVWVLSESRAGNVPPCAACRSQCSFLSFSGGWGEHPNPCISTQTRGRYQPKVWNNTAPVRSERFGSKNWDWEREIAKVGFELSQGNSCFWQKGRGLWWRKDE